MKAADFSNWQRIPDAADIAALKALGVTRVIVGSSFGTVAAAQIAACEAAGFEVQEYQFPEALRVPVAEAWWLDVERRTHVTTQDEVRAACRSAVPPIGIYTSASQWAALMGTWAIVAEFPWLKLWTASYGPLPRPFIFYGGWDHADMTQYQDTTDIGTGFQVDISDYEEEDMPLSDQDKTDIANIVKGVVGTMPMPDQWKRDIHDEVKLALAEAKQGG